MQKCPSCGLSKLRPVRRVHSDKLMHAVECQKCGLRGPFAFSDEDAQAAFEKALGRRKEPHDERRQR